jgi:hypothetical protein
MGLFSTIASAVAAETEPLTNSAALPTVVQLYHSKPLQLDTGVSHMPPYAVLTYQAVQVVPSGGGAESATATPETPSGLRASQLNKVVPAVPDFGVWNCCVATATTTTITEQPNKPLLADALLQIPLPTRHQTPTFCWTVDLSHATAAAVEPALSAMQAAVVRYLIAVTPTTENQSPVATSSTATTTVYQLRTVQFGLAAGDDSSKAAVTAAPDEATDKAAVVAIQICAKLPAGTSAGTTGAAATSDGGGAGDQYRESQVQALLMYHLRRYAAALNASLCFVRDQGGVGAGNEGTTTADAVDGGGGGSENAVASSQPTLSVHELAVVWSDLAQGKEVWMERNSIDSTISSTHEETGTIVEEQPKIYGPGHHHEELIESALLRSASYPGHWDAAKDSLWKILPPEQHQATSAVTATAVGVGDESWLSELRESVAAAEPFKTPPPKKAAGKEPASAQKTPNDAAVSNFFESLLN